MGSRITRAIREGLRHASRLPRLLSAGSAPRNDQRPVFYITEQSDWVIRGMGNALEKYLGNDLFRLDTSARMLRHSTIHFGSLHLFAGQNRVVHDPSNRVIVSVFHGDRADEGFRASLELLLSLQEHIDLVLVSTSIMHERFLAWGLAAEKLALVPIPIDLSVFHEHTDHSRRAMRSHLGIPEGTVAIGSFQKDGNGWGEGLEPKLIKGPDALVRVIGRIAQSHKVHVVLTGPARGFVKRELDALQVPYSHTVLERAEQVADYYHALDLYLVTAREEGGPMSILESMASGVPIIATCVGMAPDVIHDGVNGFMVEVDDEEALVQRASEVLSDSVLASRLTESGKKTVDRYSWQVVAEKYRQIYWPTPQ